MSVSKIIGQPIQIAVNEDYFYNLVNKFDVYVDKTLFIKEVLDSSEKAMLITYPRRWGKTLNLDMLKVFFQIENINYNKNKEKDESFFYGLIPDFFKAEVADESTSKNKKLFTDHNLKITQVSNGQYMQYQGSYPVIFITLKDIKDNSVKKNHRTIKNSG